ncbi:MAG: flagellar basal body P-ring protein FlgI [Thermoguttaceae bacterium]|jgi:hypothetical protein
MKRRLLFCCGAILLSGCTSWNLFSDFKAKPKKDEPATPETKPLLVGDLAIPFGLFPAKVEAVGLVTGLHGTGSDPEPSPQRSMLMEEMQRRGVKNPNALLTSRDVSLVMVRGILRPGVQKGDRFDVEVRTSGRSETTSLRGGYLLQTRLTDMGVVHGQLLDGKMRGTAEGPVLVDPSASAAEKSDRVLLGRGRVLGGGIAHESRSLGLQITKSEAGSASLTPEQLREAAVKSAQVANAINRRFHTFKAGIQVGVATAKTGSYVDLSMDPRYKDNVERYMQVLRAIPLRETASETQKRLAGLEKELLDPAASARAAIRLEAIGIPAIETLLKGIKSPELEVRFNSAEALAYLDRREAAGPLGEAARREPAFRAQSLTALSVIQDYAAAEQLRDLLALPSVETRYGAFRALCRINPDDALLRGEYLGGQFSYHVLDTPGAPMIHVTRTRRPEVVLFGRDQRFLTPLRVAAGNQIMVNSTGPEQITVAKFSTTDGDQKRTVSTRVDDVLRAIVELGGTYPDVVQALQEAKTGLALEGRFEVEALPVGGRTYQRPDHADEAGAQSPEQVAAGGGNSGDGGGPSKQPVVQ